MPNHRLLYLTPLQLTACRWQAGVLSEEAGFDLEAADNEFRDYLATHAGDLFTLVVNVPEEGFQLETIPFLQRHDRQIVVRRRLGQLFLGASLATAISLGYEKSRRKDERLLLAALTNNAFFEPWLSALKATETRLVAVYSLPLLSTELLQRLNIPAEHSILITLQDNSLRQTFFDRGHLAFSRVSPLANSSAAGIAQTIAGEAGKLQQYLLSQRLIGRNDTLDAHVLLYPGTAESIAATLHDSETLKFHLHNLSELAHVVGLKTIPDDHRAQGLFVHLAAQHPPKYQFADAPLRKEFRLWQMGNALRATGTVVFAACMLLAAKTFVDTLATREEARQHVRQAAEVETRYRSIVDTFPPVPISNDVLRQLIDRYQELIRRGGDPELLLGHIGRSLEQSPQIEIDSLGWAAPGALRSAERTTTPSIAPDQETLQVKGRVLLGSGANPRQLLATFDRFVADLQRDQGIEVQVLQQPFDVGSGKSLRSDEGSVTPSAPRSFSLTLSRRIGT